MAAAFCSWLVCVGFGESARYDDESRSLKFDSAFRFGFIFFLRLAAVSGEWLVYKNLSSSLFSLGRC